MTDSVSSENGPIEMTIMQNGNDHSRSSMDDLDSDSSQPSNQLIDFLPNLEDYTPTIPDAVTASFLNVSGFTSNDPRVVRLVSLAAQKFLSEISNDALQYCKVQGSNQSSKNKAKDRSYTLSFENLTPALAEHGINLRKPPYYV